MIRKWNYVKLIPEKFGIPRDISINGGIVRLPLPSTAQSLHAYESTHTGTNENIGMLIYPLPLIHKKPFSYQFKLQ